MMTDLVQSFSQALANISEPAQPKEKPGFVPVIIRNTVPEFTDAETFKTIIANAYQLYLNTGGILLAQLAKKCKMDESFIALVMKSPEYQVAMENRGVKFKSSPEITARMDYILQIITDPHDGLTMSQKLRKAKISNATYQGYLRDPYFKSQVTTLSEQLASNTHEALTQLSRKVGEGDLQAIKYQLELNGRYNPRAESQMNQAMLMTAVIDIIMRNVTDGVALKNISGELSVLAQQIEQSNQQLTIEG